MEYGKRKPLFARKPSVVGAIGEKLKDSAPAEASGGVVCPKCGHELADTPENREYAKMRGEESDEMMDSDEEDE